MVYDVSTFSRGSYAHGCINFAVRSSCIATRLLALEGRSSCVVAPRIYDDIPDFVLVARWYTPYPCFVVLMVLATYVYPSCAKHGVLRIARRIVQALVSSIFVATSSSMAPMAHGCFG